MSTNAFTRRAALGFGLSAGVLMTACSSKSATTKSSAKSTHVTIRFAQYGDDTDDVAGMAKDPIKKAVEKAVNITLKYESGTDTFDQQMSTELSTGTGPDVFPTWGDSATIEKWIKGGAVLNMSQIVSANQKRYPTLAHIFSDPKYKAFNKLYSGSVDDAYAIYGINAPEHPGFQGVPVYNTALLKQFGSGKAPTTVDEFVEFVNAVGKSGKAGWWPRNDKLTNWAEIDKTIASPQGTSISPPSTDLLTGFIPQSGKKWKLMTTSPQSKDVVKQLASMYAVNGLSRGVGTEDDFTDAYADFGAGKIGAANFGFGAAGQFRDFYNTAWAKANPGKAKPSDLTLGTSLQGSAGYSQIYSTFSAISSHFFVPASDANPERALDLIEFIASAAGQTLVFKGIKGETYTDGANGLPDYKVAAWNAANKPYGYDDGRGQYAWFQYIFSPIGMVDFTNKTWYDAVTHPADFSNQWATLGDKQLMKYAQNVIDGFISHVTVKLDPSYNYAVLPEDSVSTRNQLNDISNRYLAGMIGGHLDIDKEWPNYASQFEAAGGSKYESELNEAIAAATQNSN